MDAALCKSQSELLCGNNESGPCGILLDSSKQRKVDWPLTWLRWIPNGSSQLVFTAAQQLVKLKHKFISLCTDGTVRTQNVAMQDQTDEALDPKLEICRLRRCHGATIRKFFTEHKLCPMAIDGNTTVQGKCRALAQQLWLVSGCDCEQVGKLASRSMATCHDRGVECEVGDEADALYKYLPEWRRNGPSDSDNLDKSTTEFAKSWYLPYATKSPGM